LPRYSQGTLATLVCSPGYTLSGSSSATCVSGVLTPGIPICFQIAFSTTSTSRGFAPGTTAALRCAFGRWVVGPSFSTCTRGVFRPLLGKCSDGREEALPGVCMPLTPPTNGLITYIQAGRQENFEIGTTALLYCMASHAVTGQATVVCSKDGWQPSSGLGTI
uniref:Sushi domain-containing protein n=1 Tax=Haemonchus placei TaxID=6290 RepID=A0A0N4VWN3_HAEPC